MIPAGTLLGGIQVALVGAPVVGQVDPDGRLIHLGNLTGWWDPPATSGTTTQRVNAHGAWVGPAYYGARVIGLEARIDGFSPADSLATAGRLIAAMSLDMLARISVTDEAGTLTAMVRQEGDPLLARVGNRVTVSLSLLAPDSRRYTAPVTVLTSLPTTSGGLVLPFSLPVSLNATSSAGTLTVVNTGNIESFPVFTVSGPIPGPWSISESLTGRVLVSQDSLPAGRSLVIDTGARTALLDGVANRVVTGTWPRLTPGTNQFSFQANGYDAGALLSVTYGSAFR